MPASPPGPRMASLFEKGGGRLRCFFFLGNCYMVEVAFMLGFGD